MYYIPVEEVSLFHSSFILIKLQHLSGGKNLETSPLWLAGRLLALTWYKSVEKSGCVVQVTFVNDQLRDRGADAIAAGFYSAIWPLPHDIREVEVAI